MKKKKKISQNPRQESIFATRGRVPVIDSSACGGAKNQSNFQQFGFFLTKFFPKERLSNLQTSYFTTPRMSKPQEPSMGVLIRRPADWAKNRFQYHDLPSLQTWYFMTPQAFLSTQTYYFTTPQAFLTRQTSYLTSPQALLSFQTSYLTSPQAFVSFQTSYFTTPQAILSLQTPYFTVPRTSKLQESSMQSLSIANSRHPILETKRGRRHSRPGFRFHVITREALIAVACKYPTDCGKNEFATWISIRFDRMYARSFDFVYDHDHNHAHHHAHHHDHHDRQDESMIMITMVVFPCLVSLGCMGPYGFP